MVCEDVNFGNVQSRSEDRELRTDASKLDFGFILMQRGVASAIEWKPLAHCSWCTIVEEKMDHSSVQVELQMEKSMQHVESSGIFGKPSRCSGCVLERRGLVSYCAVTGF